MSQHTPFQAYSAKIKEVYVELRDYTFFHSPYSKTLGDARFIGRNKVKERIKSILRYSQTRSGTYLVTGCRGMGKTSVVRQAVAEHNEDQTEKTGAENTNKVFHESLMLAPMLLVLYSWLIVAFCLEVVESGALFDYMVSLVLSGFAVIISWLWWKKSGEEYVKAILPVSALPAVLFW
ncbi:MAG TPA: hypothetical protein VJ933_12520, partial [Phaeodactylibacter sp.]|nr:hypothetical protein [Phaeodactylibacter sp.]